jgi:NADPH:quinone reductase-like Zn-dependent oxidoreductase
MRALQLTGYGGPEVLTWADAPVPHAGPGQIRIAVRAASVNPVDWKLLTGHVRWPALGRYGLSRIRRRRRGGRGR